MKEKGMENVIPFPEGNDWFTWRDRKGELHRFYKGYYAIIQNPDGSYRDEYINPDLGEWEDAVLEFGEFESDKPGESRILEKRQINSRKEYEELLERIKDLNKKE